MKIPNSNKYCQRFYFAILHILRTLWRAIWRDIIFAFWCVVTLRLYVSDSTAWDKGKQRIVVEQKKKKQTLEEAGRVIKW